jgi:hypothetical protein
MHYAQAAEALGAQQPSASLSQAAAAAAVAPTTMAQSTSQPHHAAQSSAAAPHSESNSNTADVPWARNTTTSSTSTTSPHPDSSRLSRLFTQASEFSRDAADKLQGQDPLWFAKAFATRASANFEHMQKVGSQLAAAAAGRLPPEEDEH